MKKIKTDLLDLTITDDYVECEVEFNHTVWYNLEEYLTDDLLALIDDFMNGEISLFTFLTIFYDSVMFIDENEEKHPYEFTEKDWKYITE